MYCPDTFSVTLILLCTLWKVQEPTVLTSVDQLQTWEYSFPLIRSSERSDTAHAIAHFHCS